MKRLLVYGAVAAMLAVGFATSPASAQSVVRESTCTEVNGSNTMTYDCGFNVKNYTLGSPVTIYVNWSCTGTCGPLTSFGLRQSGFSPNGVSGHMVSAKRLSDGLSLTFMFDALKKTGSGATGNAHFKMGVAMDDGAGNVTSMDCPIDVHLNE